MRFWTEPKTISVVRPSTVGPSSDGQRGSVTTPGCVCAALLESPFLRFSSSKGAGDFVCVDQVAETVVEAFDSSTDVVWATNGRSASFAQLSSLHKSKHLLIAQDAWLATYQSIEIWISKWFSITLSKALRLYYGEYSYISAHQWDFPQAIPMYPYEVAEVWRKWCERRNTRAKI